MLELISGQGRCDIYRIRDEKRFKTNRLIISTAESRAICNDSMVMGVDYTQKLNTACTLILKNMQHEGIVHLEEKKTIVFNILRGGLNFGLREGIAGAFGWNLHGSSFVSAQRARMNPGSEEWHIIENDYKKVYMPATAHVVIGDVVATGTSLLYGLKALVQQAEMNHVKLESILFFTFGGVRAEIILEEIDTLCREKFEGYQSTTLCYLEGRFTVPSPLTPLTIKITGTDLVRYDALMSPEFVESQYTHPAYPLERCIIYDAGSRAFWLPEYIKDVAEYWGQIGILACKGISFQELLNQRVPILDPNRYSDVNLKELAMKQVNKLKALL